MWILERGRVLDPTRGLDEEADVVIEDGRITAVGRDAGARYPKSEAVRRLDASGRWLVPGFIDLHVHFREPGQEYKEDVASGLSAAKAGGYTAVCPMPNTKPVNDHRAVTEQMLARARDARGPRLHPFGAITMGSRGEALTEMAELKDAGAIGVSDDGVCVMNAAVMRRALEYAKTFDLLVSQHCEDHHLTHGAEMHEGAVSTMLGLRGWPREAEDVIVARDVLLNERIGARYHVAHLSTLGAARIIREAKARGVPVTAEVTPHHLLLTDRELIGYRTFCKVTPPLREEEDVEALREALRDGTIDCIATDHAPHSSLEKDCEFSAASPGMIGLETTIPLLLGLVRDGVLSALRFVEVMSSAPARIGRFGGGSLTPGALADVTILDPELRWTPSRATLHGKQLNTPWLGKELVGACTHTFVGGELVFER